jgi:hypothetical protein
MRKVSTGLLFSLFFLAPVSAHQDRGTDRINDSIWIKELTAKTDQDDGGGESEYCVRIKASHQPTHNFMDSEIIICGDADWDDPSDQAGKEWHELNPLRLPLIGNGGYLASSLRVRSHFHECSPSEAWDITLTLHEVDYTPAGEIIKELGEIIEEHGKDIAQIANIATAGQATVITKFAGDMARWSGKWIDEIVNDTEFLGRYDASFDDGEGDPSNTVDADENGNARHFKASASKKVAKVGVCTPMLVEYRLDNTRRAINDAGEVCYSNGASPLCLNAGQRSSQQFERLRSVAAKIAEVSPEADTLATAEGAKHMRSSLIGLTGGIAAQAVEHQMGVAQSNLEADGAFEEIAVTTLKANQLWEAAIENSSAENLIKALDGFEEVHTVLADLNYGKAYDEKWRAHIWSAFKLNTNLSKAHFEANDSAAGKTHILTVLEAYESFSPDIREWLTEKYFGKYQIRLDQVMELPEGERIGAIASQL